MAGSCVRPLPIYSTRRNSSIPSVLPVFFFFKDTPTTEIYTLSLHDALPIFEQALLHCESELRAHYRGWPQILSPQGRVVPARFAVLSLGKLGGYELNYSSDVDRLY